MHSFAHIQTDGRARLRRSHPPMRESFCSQLRTSVKNGRTKGDASMDCRLRPMSSSSTVICARPGAPVGVQGRLQQTCQQAGRHR